MHADLIDVPCPGCASDRRRAELTARDPLTLDSFNLVRCTACGLAYVSPRPRLEHIGDYYSGGYFAERHPFFRRQLMALRTRKIGRPTPGARLLDIGCGRGDFMLACRRLGWEVVGTEQARSPVMGLARTLGIEVVTLADLAGFPDASFDVVTLWHVLEHLPDPRDALRAIYRLLRPGGRVIVELPNLGSWQARIAGRDWYHLDVPRHLSHFEARTLMRLLSSEGLSPEVAQTFSLEYDTFGLFQSLLNKLCRTPNHLYQILIGAPTAHDLRDTIVSVALLPPLGLLAFLSSLLAGALGAGGVLRITARKGPIAAPSPA
jgi:2-polyprenyl-3-methyl-5-hydroxy-6-metoxy-1,4-benzoquinol methylase